MSRLRLARIALLAADVVAHLLGFAQARRADAPIRDRAGMLGGAVMYKVLAVGVAARHPVAEQQAVVAPVGGIVALLATWRRSGIPALTRAGIIGIDLGLVALGIAARREATSADGAGEVAAV